MTYPFIGIDQSYSGFALAIYCHPSEIYQTKTSRWEAKNFASQSDRLARIFRDVQMMLSGVCCAFGGVSAVALEGYSHGSKYQREALGELGATVKLAISEIAGVQPWRRPLVVPPTTLKKFVTGKGNATKQEMIATVSHRYGAIFRDDNLADAYALARVASAVYTGRGTPQEIAAVQHLKPTGASPLQQVA
ncbi:hypothetical protein ADL22_12240 [Streptomyces sp. NRRL F-4489]|uniref:hypothetical protein n=1 Tax=Streptomyces sp. NRRL F-4489 TaxID=1609095 RepID=UPI000748A64A|nr:hypothetical protein [Streptomyces sp. NRRL F-4489]KUL44706.1 hypothetical protein ADL22_12240 [Streptomyces sp. NRRL F-4489]